MKLAVLTTCTTRSRTRVCRRSSSTSFHADPRSTPNTNNERRLGTSQMLLKMATNFSGIPVVDFSAMSLQNDSSMRENSDAVKQLADHVHQAFSTIGFVYLKNHGIPQEKVACKHV